MAGSDAAQLERRSPRQVAMLRLPWVLLTLLIEMMAGVVIHFFDKTLGKVILLPPSCRSSRPSRATPGFSP